MEQGVGAAQAPPETWLLTYNSGLHRQLEDVCQWEGEDCLPAV